ncbi:amino acid adenylation domain-containing protein [Streptomyces lydicus]|uniref:non-ribosomal peptide synthetase n=1 Tax=Streptomyces lydicus TaxID=47763 RepID=UPI0036FBF5A9
MSDTKDPWARCLPADRKVIEDLQGLVEPVAPDDLVRVLRQQYAELGSQIAVIDGDREWTYEELGERVLGLCARLDETYSLREGQDPKIFAVAIDRSADLVAAVHAIALTGSAYCPLSMTDPPPWRESVIRRSGAFAVLVSGGDVQLPAFTDQFDVRQMRSAPQGFKPVPRGADDASQIIFTSGSTGQPKGVICTLQGFGNRIRWMQQTFPLSAADRVALKTPFTFDVAGWELFWPQYAGAQTVVVPAGEHTSPEALISTFNMHRVTVAHFVPSMLRLWLRAGGAQRCADLRMVFCSGEALDPDLVKEFRQQSDAELHNLYGPTEASIDVTHFQLTAEPLQSVPIGRPISNTHIYILDQDQAICPIGETGEIYIQGIGVAAGYVGASEEDALRFSPLSLPAAGQWRTFRTGDMGRYTPDGQIEYCGRIDSQVKIRGQRVELAEVEAALRNHEMVLDACALTYDSGTGRRCLAAHVVLDPRHNGTDPVGMLTDHLMRNLPSRSIPARILVVDELPLGAHGKVDRNRLVEPGRMRPELAQPFHPPATRIEMQIAGIWAQVLDLHEVGRRDNFHELGGDSLAAVEISFLVAERLGLDYDDDVVSDILLRGDTVENAARAAVDGGIEDSSH